MPNSTRDTRLDPQPGDVLRQKEGRYPEREIMGREARNVWWTGDGYPHRIEVKMRLASWRNWAKGAEVVHAAH